MLVIPAQAGIQNDLAADRGETLDSGFRRNDDKARLLPLTTHH
jgi:hypothetical protein